LKGAIIFFLTGVTLQFFETAKCQTADLGEWFTRADLPTARQEMPHAVLQGRIFVPGGFRSGGSATNLVEVFSPETNSWSTAAPLPAPMHHLHVASANGRLYVLGGYETSNFSPSNRVFEYDLQGNSWTSKMNMLTARGAGVAVEFGGKIFVIGGAAGGVLSVNEMYDPSNNTWTSRASMPTPREHLAAAAIDSLIYVVGGRVGSTNRNTLEAYSPASNRWYARANMPTARGGLAAAALRGRLYVFGGEFFGPLGSGVFEETEEYDPATNTWRALEPMPVPRHGLGAAAVGDSIFLIGGGPVAGFGVTDVNSLFVPPANVTGVVDQNQPMTFTLFQNYPNPFNPTTTIRFSIEASAEASLKIYDVRGREMATLLEGKINPGEHELFWRAEGLASGVYFYRLEAKRLSGSSSLSFSDMKKMILLK
jgi:N-acetylneuraminic acid mutarotase